MGSWSSASKFEKEIELELSKPSTNHLRRLCLTLAAAFIAMAITLPGVAHAANRASAEPATARAETTLSLGVLGTSPAASLPTSGTAIETRSKRPKVWKMPVTTALNATKRFARLIYEDTTPNDFDDSGRIIGESDWDDYDAWNCKRKSRSRVNCLGLVEGDFDVVDENDTVVGEDTFYCIWEQTNWYPRAKKKRLKTSIPNEYCGWESED